ncbi:beta-N-acetylhexosaminidase [Akkermansia glycaniphila]|uniref:beta-N-acetylhexosaminidase n=1 Tax=Akkermansia glycaniphila TaxID=1679444 RepID=UPI001FF00D03|nr:beta-N-acetylhexosaminidase [Akkermansia glycaniphila]
MNKTSLYLHACIGLLAMGITGTALSQQNIIPRPAQLTVEEGAPFVLNRYTALYCDSSNPEFVKETEKLRSYLNKGTRLHLSNYRQNKNAIIIREDKSLADKGEEAYKITAKNGIIEIAAPGPKGIFYAGQSLAQMLPIEFFVANGNKNGIVWTLAEKPFTITDYPRFSWRAMHLDEARHFWGMETVKQLIDQMALLKMNILHWHLTDDAGWRIEIKKYPKLTEIGSKREDTETGTWRSGKSDGFPHQGFYTQDHIREIVKYAADRNITIVPEIEMPGHAAAAIYCYPELGIKIPDKVCTTFVDNYAFNPASERTYRFLSDVLDEIADLFPSKVLHIGGDEVRYNDQWKGEPIIEEYMKKNNMKTFADVQLAFSNRMSQIVARKGRRMMGWNEILGHDVNGDGGGTAAAKLDKNAIIHFWKGSAELAKQAIRGGHDVINSTHSNTYLDYGYGSISLQKAYDFEPVFAGLEKEYESKVKGLGCQMWTEWVADTDRLHYQLFPRLIAFAEVGWTDKNRKDYADFQKRLKNYAHIMDQEGIRYAKDIVGKLTHGEFFNTPKAGTWTPQTLGAGQELTLDLTPFVKNAGKYQLTFLYEKGLHAAGIEWVALLENGREISRDTHPGHSGGDQKDIQYKLDVPTPKPGAAYTLKAKISGKGGNDSTGIIYVTAP